MEGILLRQTSRATPPAKGSLALSLPRGAAAQHFTAFAESRLWAQLRVRPGQAGTQHLGPGEMLTGSCLVTGVDICSPEFLGTLESHFCSACNHTQLKLPTCRLFIYLNIQRYLPSRCVRHCRIAGDEATNTSDLVSWSSQSSRRQWILIVP